LLQLIVTFMSDN